MRTFTLLPRIRSAKVSSIKIWDDVPVVYHVLSKINFLSFYNTNFSIPGTVGCYKQLPPSNQHGLMSARGQHWRVTRVWTERDCRLQVQHSRTLFVRPPNVFKRNFVVKYRWSPVSLILMWHETKFEINVFYIPWKALHEDFKGVNVNSITESHSSD